MERNYSEEKLECVCLLYKLLESKNDLSDSLIHAKEKGVDVSWKSHQEEVKELIDKTRGYGLEDVPIFKSSITKLKAVYELE